MSSEKIFLTTKQASEYLHITAGTLAVWRTNRTYNIPYVKCGGRVLYLKSDLDNWLKSRTIGLEANNDC